MRLLIDECLSPALVQIAHAAGYEASHCALARIQQLGSMINRVVEVEANGVVRDYLQPPLD